MSVSEGWTFAIVAGALGVAIMAWRFNGLSAALGLFSLILYAFVYTPLKKLNSISVLVGAVPGALPCLIGWVAGSGVFSPFEKVPGTNMYNAAGWALFGLQFLWQFPHFFAIAWVAHNDYAKAGFKLLPSVEGPTKFTALQSIAYALLMVPVGILPYLFGVSGRISLIIVFLANVFMIVQCLRLYQGMDVPSARRVMFSSYIYLPVVLLALLADKLQPTFN
jgi:protoheme IX farnesyltransferase